MQIYLIKQENLKLQGKYANNNLILQGNYYIFRISTKLDNVNLALTCHSDRREESLGSRFLAALEMTVFNLTLSRK